MKNDQSHTEEGQKWDKYAQNRHFTSQFTEYNPKQKQQLSLNYKNAPKVSSFKEPYLFNYVFPIQDKPLIKMPCLGSLFAKFKLYETV